MPTLTVRLLQPWNGYKENSILVVTEKTYYQTRSEGIKMNLVAESEPAKKEKKPVTFVDYDSLHDRPFVFDEEE